MCLQMSERVSVIVVFLSKQVTYEFNVTILSAGHDIFCKHGLLQESSCSNMRFVCKITLIPAFEEITVCVCGRSVSLLLVAEGSKRSAYDGCVYTL